SWRHPSDCRLSLTENAFISRRWLRSSSSLELRLAINHIRKANSPDGSLLLRRSMRTGTDDAYDALFEPAATRVRDHGENPGEGCQIRRQLPAVQHRTHSR